MDSSGGFQRLKSESVAIKSEFGPSLASLPMAPTVAIKNEFKNEFGSSLNSLPAAPVLSAKHELDDKKFVCRQSRLCSHSSPQASRSPLLTTPLDPGWPRHHFATRGPPPRRRKFPRPSR